MDRFPSSSNVSVMFLDVPEEIRVLRDLPCTFKFVRNVLRSSTDCIYLCLQMENEFKPVVEFFLPNTKSLQQTISFDVSQLSTPSGWKYNFVYANQHGDVFGYSRWFTLHIDRACAIYSNQTNEAIPQKYNPQDSLLDMQDIQNQFNSLKVQNENQQLKIQEKEAIINEWQEKYQELLLTNEKLDKDIQGKQVIIDEVLGRNIELELDNKDKQRLESLNKENCRKLQDYEEMKKRLEIMNKQHQEEMTKIKQELNSSRDANVLLRNKLEDTRKKEAAAEQKKSKSFISRGIEYFKGSESGTNGKAKRDYSPTHGYDESHTFHAEIIQEKPRPKSKPKPVAMVRKGRSTGGAAKPSSYEAPWEDPTVIGSRGFYHRDDFTLNATTETYANSSENPTPMDCNNTRGGDDDESPSHSTKDDSNPNNSTEAGDGDKKETDHIAEQATLAFKTKECDLCGMVFNDEHDRQYILDHCKEHFDG